MNWVFRQECSDCKYCLESQCTHPHYMYCDHGELWAPKEKDGTDFTHMFDNVKVFNQDEFKQVRQSLQKEQKER